MHVELCRRFGDGDETIMSVSTVAAAGAGNFDEQENYRIHRQPFPFGRAKIFSNQLRWAHWLTSGRSPDFDVLHCGNIRPVRRSRDYRLLSPTQPPISTATEK